MSKKTGLYFLGFTAAAFAVYELATKSGAAKALQLKILSLEVKNFTKLYLSIQIFNPTNSEIRIDSISGQVFFNNKQIGVIQYINNVPIAARSYSTFKDVIVELTPAGGIVLATEIITHSAKSGEFLLSGKTYVKGIGIPFTQSIKVF